MFFIRAYLRYYSNALDLELAYFLSFRRPVSTSALRPSSTKRQAPSPPVAPSTGKGLVVRRVVSSDGRASSAASGVSRNLPIPNSNVQKAPSMRRIVVGSRRSSVDNGLDSSFSESEGPFNGEAEQVSPKMSLILKSNHFYQQLEAPIAACCLRLKLLTTYLFASYSR